MSAGAERRKWEVGRFGAHCTCAVGTVSVLRLDNLQCNRFSSSLRAWIDRSHGRSDSWHVLNNHRLIMNELRYYSFGEKNGKTIKSVAVK
jgi:hypothetical protein